MRRREFVTLLSGLVMWPLTVRAQQPPDRIRRIGVLMIIAETESEADSDMRAFRQGLTQLGWEEGKNVNISYRWAAGNPDQLHANASQLANLTDLIVAQGTPGLAAARNATHSLPIVFVNVTDPVAQGFVRSLAQPGGNITGFALFEGSMGAKWLEALKELAPETKRVALMFNPTMAPYFAMYFRSMEAAAPHLAMQPYKLPIHDEADITRAFATVADERSTGVVVLLDAFTLRHRDLIISKAAEYRLPVVYADRQFAESGGSVAYGVDRIDQFRQAGVYIDRIFKGAKPEDLPVQHPTRFELIINLKTAKRYGLTIPQNLLFRADDVIE
jgi:putative ABC transport system substrate-binding protein